MKKIRQNNLKLLLINCKTYSENSKRLTEKTIKAAEKVQEKRKKEQKEQIEIALSVTATNIHLSNTTKIPIYAEHTDEEKPGAHTGKIIAEDVKINGAKGSLLNHSEDKYTEKKIKNTIKRLKENKLISIVCVKNSNEAKKISLLKPDYIAIEPPELIGGEVSVSKAKPEIITKTISKITNKKPVLVGAGIKNTEDVKIAIKLGAKGILVASGITKAKNKIKAIENLAKGFD